MRKAWMAVFAAAALGLAGAAWAHEGMADGDDMKGMDMKGDMKGDTKDMDMKAKPGKTVTVTGEILDMDCYMNEGAKGKDHQSCAVMCLNNGAPVGLLTADGKAYFLTANEEKGMMKWYEQVRGWGGEKAKITGVIQTRAGATCLRVDNSEKL